jgi:hypothetical protein
MKTRLTLILMALLIVTAACGPEATPPPADEPILTVTSAEGDTTYTLAELQAMPASNIESDDGAFVGVTLTDLLAAAGFEDTAAIAEVRAIASDGFSSTYDESYFTREDAVLAYARQAGDLNSDELPLRMVIPGEEGRMQPRQITTIEVTLSE